MKIRDIIHLLEEDGWILVRTRGSHHQYRHPIKTGIVTIAGSPNHDLHPKTLGSILKQSGLRKDADQ